jgi:pyrimidine-nucleoside phosphorylase
LSKGYDNAFSTQNRSNGLMDEAKMRRAIERKRDGEALSEAEWEEIVRAYMEGRVDDAQMAALAMACVFCGLTTDEAAALTKAMAESGEMLKHPDGAFVVDKHSSGGVGDIVSLVAVPLVAACGVPVAKLSGRALGHTGGTIDKLEAIEGFNASLSMEAFLRQVERVGCAIAAQSDRLVPADKRIYHLRDRTATVRSIGFVTASILSKKIAAGAHAFAFDVKCGTAAFMSNREEATQLARMLVDVARRFGRKAKASVTDMHEPLGRTIGTGVEVIEACELLRGDSHDARAREVSVHVATTMLELAGVSNPRAAAERALSSGAAYEKFIEMVRAQGGSERALRALEFHPMHETVRAPRPGYVVAIDGRVLGHTARTWSSAERTAGIRVHVRVGDRVDAGDALAEVYGTHAGADRIAHAVQIGDAPPQHRELIYATI